jgi:predicted nucleic acid-binding Zn ribbon protein
MKRTNTQPLGKLLEEFFESNPQMADKLAETRMIDYWSNVMSPAISRYTHNLFIKNRILYVKLTSSVLKNELMMCREQLVINLNKEVGREIIDKLIFI